ncbi:polysaccharide degrading enzyme [Chimaeribacter arupi]|uniref:chitinase n=1 Tax=Chimaeribacter arupi TaxID=2060066 RepID=A0A2N5EPS1_9GAMM|nr:glycosyl hydrolase family 18 protein [Chimaeribacter arupi]PLR39070.1 polysaccharide degrading enzyme [Chimaeribacter arupi]PLR49909.1 polysaccharide degrading enzyme [Chimaeribacter arupi]PLR51410.1 polysaccharide degrading enzyme [Chimaeribacter arupi]WKZ94215.1 glycosyl hydrolase family 18 protein [Chimaeribacter arupi]
MKLNKITAALILSAVALPLYTSAATLSANDSTNTISGLDSSQMISTDNGHKWKAYTNESQNNFPGTLTVTVAVKDDQAINSVEYDPSVAYSEAGTVVRYNGYYWTNQWWANPGELPGSNAVWTRGDKIGINTLATFKFTPYTGQEAIDFQNQQKANVAAQRKVTGYFPEWGVYDAHENFTPDKIDFSLLTHLNYGFGIVKSGEVEIHDTEQGPLLLAELDEMTEEAGVSYMASIGGWNNSEEGVFEEATATDAGVEKLANSMMAFMLEWGFDGIDVDWEYPDSDTEKTQFTKLIQSLRSKLDAQGKKDDKYYQLSAAVTTNHNNIKFINPEVTTPLLDSVNVMAYDIHGAFDPITGHNAPLYANSQDADLKLNSSSAMKEYADTYKVPKNKLLMGIPFYGRGWGDVEPTEIVQGLPGLFAPGSATIHGAWDDDGQFTGTNPWYLLKQKVASGDYTRYWDRESRVPYLYNAATKEFLTYDDPQSVREKVDFINNEGYGGAIIWDLSGDTPDHELGKIVKDVKDAQEQSEAKDLRLQYIDNALSVVAVLDQAHQEAENRYVIYLNNNYLSESYAGNYYYCSKSIQPEEHTVTLKKAPKALKVGDVIELRKIYRRPVESSADYAVLRKITVTEEVMKNPTLDEDVKKAKDGFKNLSINKKGFSLVETKDLFNDNLRIMGFINGAYAMETFKGVNYYSSKAFQGNDVKVSTNYQMKAGDIVTVKFVAGSPGNHYSNNLSTLAETTLKEVKVTADMLK